MYALMIGHRFKARDSRDIDRAHAWWRVERGNTIIAARKALVFNGYSQLHQVSAGHPLYLLLRATRSAPVLALTRRLKGRAAPADTGALPGDAERWDVVEYFSFESREAARAMLTRPETQDVLREMSGQQRLRCRISSALGANVLLVTPEPVQLLEKITTMLFIRALPDQGRGQFQDYWRNSHQAFVASLQGALGYRHYEQCHVSTTTEFDALGNAYRPAFDGVAVLSYTSWGHLVMGALNPRTLLANFRLVADEQTFFDHRQSTLLLGRQIVYLPHFSRPEQP